MPEKKFNKVNKQKIFLINNIIYINVISFTGLEIVMLNKQNHLYKFMKQTKKYDIILLDTYFKLLTGINKLLFLVFLPLYVQYIIRLIYIIYWVLYSILNPDYFIILLLKFMLIYLYQK